MNGWYGVDLDGTLALYVTWVSNTHIGEPVPRMLARVKQWLEEKKEVRIFTARVHPLDQCIRADTDFSAIRMSLADRALSPDDMMKYDSAILGVQAIQQWSRKHVGVVLPVTNLKDYGMIELWDDRCVQVRPNTGIAVGKQR